MLQIHLFHSNSKNSNRILARERDHGKLIRVHVKSCWLVGRFNWSMIHLPTRRNERLLGRVCVTYSAYDGANRDQAAGKPVLLAEPERHLLRVAVI